MKYTFTEQLHNYAVWTAARAVQRNFTNTKNIKAAIEQAGLKELIDRKEEMTIDQFDIFHKTSANIIIEYLRSIGIQASYGQSAKMIAIYIKTAIVIKDSGLSNISKIAHPPIDNILLTQLHKKHPELDVSGINWTQLDEKKYFYLIKKLRTLNMEYFWELEKYWTPVQKE